MSWPHSSSKPLAREAESLGWLAQSSVQPRKRRDIEGVSASSIVDLKAQLYRTQEEARLRAEGVLGPNDSSTRRKAGYDVTQYNKKNSGVEERSKRDEDAVQRAKDRVGECYAALERKAKLYEQIVRGEAPDQEEVYNVDFLQKHTLQDEAELLGTSSQAFFEDRGPRDDEGCSELPPPPTLEDEPAPQDQERRDRIQAIHEVARETQTARSKADEVKQKRLQQQAQKRERLKMEYLRKQAAKIRAEQAAKKTAG
eukprot:CAMPEP_0117680550 /NCGR_PEP_ID=MMETSP0804-20121206/18422_1 /TAXON_ID=1074897 /ORGANISM="Tetraselmis astigmatica, Strain CCMP880" /LENGTH=254 /DNA_ID=CAMNT_0005490075 /DNA_START=327 /DNA_END=1092 /DNA_ORIENTATION=+